MQKTVIGASSDEWLARRAPLIGGESDINLLELYAAIRARWSWIVAGVLLGSLVAVTYLMLAPPLYESHATIQIGKIHEFGAIEDIDTLTAKLMEQYGRLPGRDDQEPYLKHAGKAARQNNLLTLTAVGRSPEQARDYAGQIVTALTRRHEQIYREVIDPIRRQLAITDAQTARMRKQAGEMDDLVARLRAVQPVQASLAAIERSRLSVQISDLERDRISLQQTIGEPYSSPTRVITQPDLAQEQAAPRSTVVLGIGLGAGMALGLLAIFLGARRGTELR